MSQSSKGAVQPNLIKNYDSNINPILLSTQQVEISDNLVNE